MTVLMTKNSNITTSLTTSLTTTNKKKSHNRKRNNSLKEINTGYGNNEVGYSICVNVNNDRRGRGRGSRIRRKSGENPKKKDEIQQKTNSEIITKPVIESTNPFFIAVCAPETYKPTTTMNMATASLASAPISGVRPGTGSYGGRPRINVFLRSRPATRSISNSGISYPNRFIHHPVIQNLRQVESKMEIKVTEPEPEPCILSNDLTHFPSLGGEHNVVFNNTNNDNTASPSISKLNFKEMVMRNSSATGSVAEEGTDARTTTSFAYASSNSNIVSYHITPNRQLSSNNIFLAAFNKQHHGDDGYDVDDNYDNYNNHDEYNETHTYAGGSDGHGLASSVLIDSCDHKYDKLYK